MTLIKGLFVLLLSILSAAYFVNIGAGVAEIAPDNLPVIGNIDEAVATLLPLNCIAYFGLDMRQKSSDTQKANG